MRPEELPGTVEVPLAALEAGMVLAESVWYDYATDGKQKLALQEGRILPKRAAQIIRDVDNFPQVKRQDGKKRGAAMLVYDFASDQQRKDMLQHFGHDVTIVEKMSPLVSDLRAGQLAMATGVDRRVKGLVEGLAESEDAILKQTALHRQISEFLASDELKDQIYRDLLGPLLKDPVVNVYLSYHPESAEAAFDVASLAAAICILTDVDPYPAVIAGLINRIGEDYLASRFTPDTDPYIKLHPYRDLVLVERILKPGGKRLDGLSEDSLQAVKHRLTRRDGRRYEGPVQEGAAETILYVGHGMRNPDFFAISTELETKLKGHRDYIRLNKLPGDTIQEVPTFYNEPVYLALRYINAMEKSRTKLHAAKVFNGIRTDKGLCASDDFVDALLKIIGEKYFKKEE
jgi:hypothetical protein